VVDISGKPEGLSRIKKNFTLETNISTVLIEKMLQFKLPAAHSALQQARHRGLARSILLRRAATFRHEENDGLQDTPRADCPCAERDGCENPMTQLHTYMEGKVIEEIRNFLEWGGGTMGWDHQVGVCGFSGRGFDTRGCFLLRLPCSWVRGSCGFVLRLRPGRLSGGGHFRLLGRLRDQLRRGIWVSGEVVAALTTYPSWMT